MPVKRSRKTTKRSAHAKPRKESRPIVIDHRNAPAPRSHALPSGRHVVVKIENGAEHLEIRSPAGEVEVRIELTDAGPIVKLHAAELQLGSPGKIALQCGELELTTERNATLSVGGELTLTTDGQHS